MNASEINDQTKDINQTRQNISVSGIDQNNQYNKTDVQIVDKNISSEIKNNKGKTNLFKYLFIISIVIIVITVIIIVIVLVIKKKDEKKL